MPRRNAIKSGHQSGVFKMDEKELKSTNEMKEEEGKEVGEAFPEACTCEYGARMPPPPTPGTMQPQS